jgi:hypothetical protein
MKLNRFLVLTMVLLFSPGLRIFGQTFELSIRNKTISGSDFLFDLYMLRTGSMDLYLGHSDFSLVFNRSSFTSPTTMVVTAADTLLAHYSLSTSIVSDSIITLNVGQPSFANQSEFDSKIQMISHDGMGTLIGKMKITGVSSIAHARDLHWATDSTDMYYTILHNLSDADPWRSNEITNNGSYSKDVKVYVTAWLEGAFAAGMDTMTTALNPAYLPVASPYADSASTLISAIPDSAVDYVYLEFRRHPHSATMNSQSTFISTHGRIFSINGTKGLWIDLVPGYYYILARHRNHLAIMSADSLYLNSTPVEYNFTDSPAKFYGSGGCVELGSGSGKWGMIAGDTNGSGIITVADKAPIVTSLNKAGYYKADTNFSGIVTVADKAKIVANLNKASTVPSQN